MAQPVGVDNTFRRKFDKEEYLQRACERKEKELEGLSESKSKDRPVQRKPLKHRDYEVDLDSRLGKSQLVTPLGQQAGYFYSVCECVVKDSANYLDHINGKKHQRALGMSMRVEKASLEQVHERLENHVKKRKDHGTFMEQDLDERILKQQQKEEETKRQKRETKNEKKKEMAIEEEIKVDPELASMMGFGCFGTTSRNMPKERNTITSFFT